jgi:hypothetical protein
MRKRVNGSSERSNLAAAATEAEWDDPELDRLLDMLIRNGLASGELRTLVRPKPM